MPCAFRITLHLAILLFAVVSATAQGPLTPPGPPAPTMKTLDQVEPAIPVIDVNTPGDTDAMFKITKPGSYYLTGNIDGNSTKGAIEIASHHVTLDLRGYRLGKQGSQVTGSGIWVSMAGAQNITIRNGTVNGWSGCGIDAAQGLGVQLQNLQVTNNQLTGIKVGAAAMLVQCQARGNLQKGIHCTGSATLQQCQAFSNTQNGIEAVSSILTDCQASQNGAYGIAAANGSLLRNCVANANGSHGINASQASVVDCMTHGNARDGIYADKSRVNGCMTVGNTNAGIEVFSYCNVMENHSLSNKQYGIQIYNPSASSGGFSNLIKNNQVSNNATYGMLCVTPAKENVIMENLCNGTFVSYMIMGSNIFGELVNSESGLRTNENGLVNINYEIMD